MERTEPTFVPEWLKNSGSLITSHQSSLNSDDKSESKSLRNKCLENDLGRPTTSSYLRSPCSSSNGWTHVRSYSSFGRNRDRDRDKNKEKAENWHRDYSDSLANIFPSWFEKDVVRRSSLNVSAKRAESWPRKLAAEKTGNNNGKIPFERDFRSLGAVEKKVDSEVPSPVLSSVIESLPVGNSGVSGDVWSSALAEVPQMVGTNGPTSTSATTNAATGRIMAETSGPTSIRATANVVTGRITGETSGPTSICATANVATSRNMAETLAQGYPRAQTAPQLSVETQRLEELAVKRSRQLIPMTPMTKALASNSCDKPKIKVGGHLPLQNSHSASPQPACVNADVTKTSSSSSTVGKLHVLKPSRERNSTTPTTKEVSSPTGGNKLPNSHLVVSLDRKASVSCTPEKRPSHQAKSRNDFFNRMRKKSMANNSSSFVSPDTHCTESADDKPGEGGTEGGDGKFTKNGKNDSRSDAILYPEEEEARFLRSLGWEETTEEEEEGLTEEEINSFYRDVSKYVNSRMVFKGIQPKCLMPLNLQMGKNGGDTKVDS